MYFNNFVLGEEEIKLQFSEKMKYFLSAEFFHKAIGSIINAARYNFLMRCSSILHQMKAFSECEKRVSTHKTFLSAGVKILNSLLLATQKVPLFYKGSLKMDVFELLIVDDFNVSYSLIYDFICC